MNGAGWAKWVDIWHSRSSETKIRRHRGERPKAERFRLTGGGCKGHPIVVVGVGGPFVVFVSNYPQHVGFMLLILPSVLDRLEAVLECHSG